MANPAPIYIGAGLRSRRIDYLFLFLALFFEVFFLALFLTAFLFFAISFILFVDLPTNKPISILNLLVPYSYFRTNEP